MQRVVGTLCVVSSAGRFAFVDVFEQLSRFNLMVFVEGTLEIYFEITHRLQSRAEGRVKPRYL